MKRCKKVSCFVLVLLLITFLIQPALAEIEVELGDQLSLQAPECLSVEELEINGSVRRLKSEEPDLNSIVYENEDGSRTLYYFQNPVKYVGDDGRIYDKSNLLCPVDSISEKNTYAYKNAANNIVTSFPYAYSPESGIVVEAEGISVEVLPQYTNAIAQRVLNTVTVENARSLRYDNVFGANTAVRYYPTFSGVKEEIVLYERPESCTFSFVIKTNGLDAIKEGNQIGLYDEGKRVGYISEIIVYDSSEVVKVTLDNFVSLATSEVDGEYYYSVTVDEDFIMSEETTYPVYVDPTITINPSGSGTSKTIIDSPVYSGSSNGRFGTTILNRVGYVGTNGGVTYGAGRLLMKFPGLLTNELFQSLATSEITNVSLMMSEALGGTGTSVIRAHYYTGANWTEDTVSYSNSTWNGLGELITSVSIAGAETGYRAFNLTTAAKIWRDDSVKAEKGIILYNFTSETNSANQKVFYSTESTSSAPYLSVTYSKRSFNRLPVAAYYDQSYYVRYGELEATSRTNISNYLRDVSTRLNSLLGIGLQFSTPAYFQSTCDACKGTVTLNNIDDLCEHAVDHTNIENIHADFRDKISVNDGAASILFSLHRIITDYGGADGPSDNRSVTMDGKYVYILKFYSYAIREAQSKSVIMHELNHVMGAKDHYHEIMDDGSCRGGEICSVCGINPRPSTCLMIDSGSSIDRTDVLCPGCIRDIREYLIDNGFGI